MGIDISTCYNDTSDAFSGPINMLEESKASSIKLRKSLPYNKQIGLESNRDYDRMKQKRF